MTTWFTEKHTPHCGITLEVKESIYRSRSEYQLLEIADTYEFGRIFLLDGKVMLTEHDEFIYHEMLAHVPLNTHPDPKKVLVIGGGDGGTVREVLKHPGVEEITLVEIDREVVQAALLHLPGISEGLKDPRTEVVYDDGVRYVAGSGPGSFDVILIDSTDPVGPAEALYSEDFFRNCEAALGADGVMVCQSESPFHHLPFMVGIHRLMGRVFPRTGFYLAPVPTYPSGTWSFLMGSKASDTDLPVCREHGEIPSKYYSPHIHRASFTLPRFLNEALSR